jgi:ATP:ADP antiporter, AAA family
MTDASPSLLRRVVDVRPEERRAMWLSCAYFFFVLSSWFILRPIRDEMGAAGGVRNLSWLFTGTLAVTLVANPLFSALTVRLPARRFVPITYRFFMVNLVIFYLLWRGLSEAQHIWLGRAFFVWSSMYNLFIISVFWAFMVDVWRTDQGKRLFGFIGVGGTIGSLTGSAVTAALAERIGPVNLLLVSVVLLELAVQCMRRIPMIFRAVEAPDEGRTGTTLPPLRSRQPAIAGLSAPTPAVAATPAAAAVAATPHSSDRPLGGSIAAGVTHVLRSPYLLGICTLMLLFTVTSTFLYFQQADIAERTFTDRGARTAFFARIDVWVNALTVFVQVFLTGRILKHLGVAVALSVLPVLSIVGFTALGLVPTIAVFVAFQVARRAGSYALERPSREVLFTAVSREDKYKAKSLIDTFVYRGGDQIGAWTDTVLRWAGLGMSGIAFAAVPVCLVWLGNALWLARKNAALARARGEDRAPGELAAGAGIAVAR